MAVLGIDLGTSSVKAVVIRLDGTLIGQATGDYAVSNRQPGWSESDPDRWLEATAQAVRAAVAAAGVQPAAAGLSGPMRGPQPNSTSTADCHEPSWPASAIRSVPVWPARCSPGSPGGNRGRGQRRGGRSSRRTGYGRS